MGHHLFFTLFELDVRSRRKSLGTPEISKFFLRWKSVSTMIHKFNARCTSSSFQQQEKKSIDGFYPFCFYSLTLWKSSLRNGTTYIKRERWVAAYIKRERWVVLFFSPERWHISQQKEKRHVAQAFWQWKKPVPVCLLSQPKQNATSALKPECHILLLCPWDSPTPRLIIHLARRSSGFW